MCPFPIHCVKYLIDYCVHCHIHSVFFPVSQLKFIDAIYIPTIVPYLVPRIPFYLVHSRFLGNHSIHIYNICIHINGAVAIFIGVFPKRLKNKWAGNFILWSCIHHIKWRKSSLHSIIINRWVCVYVFFCRCWKMCFCHIRRNTTTHYKMFESRYSKNRNETQTSKKSFLLQWKSFFFYLWKISNSAEQRILEQQ